MYLLYIFEYYNNPTLLKDKRKIINKSRTSKKIKSLSHIHKFTLFDYALCFQVYLQNYIEFISIFPPSIPLRQNNIRHHSSCTLTFYLTVSPPMLLDNSFFFFCHRDEVRPWQGNVISTCSSMGSEPQKTQGLQNFFHDSFVELFLLIILVKKIFSIGHFFPCYC